MHKLPVVMAAVACMLCMTVTAALLQTAGGNASTEIPIMCSSHLQQSKVDYVQRDLQATSKTTVLSLLTLEVATFAASSSGSTGVPDRHS